jgi:hypothetical protein
MGHVAGDSVNLDWAHTLITYQTELLTRAEAVQLAWWLESRFGPQLARITPERVPFVWWDAMLLVGDPSEPC